MKILIVDDDPDVRAVLRMIVEQQGHEVIEAGDGQEGFVKAVKHKPDAIISDALMPKMDGFQLLRAVRRDEILGTVPFVIYSAIYTEDKERELAFSLGADGLIVKPKYPDEFWKEFSAALDARASKQRQIFQARTMQQEEEELRDYCQMVASKLETKVRELETTIAENRLTKKIAQESEERYRILYESNPHPMWVYDLETLSFLAVNDAAVSKYGYSCEEFVAMTIKEIRPAEDVSALLDKLSRGMEGFDAAGTWRHRKKDGAVIDVEITTHTLTFAARPAKLVMAIDVTERRRMEKAIRDASDEWRSTFDAMSDAVALLDSDGKILRCNKAMAELIGKTFPEIIGRYCWEAVHGASGPVDDCPHEAMKKSRRRETLEIQFSNRWFIVTAEPFSDDKGNIVGAVHIMSDITGRKQLEDALKAAVVRAENEKARSESIIAAIGDGITIQDTDFRILYQNQALKDMMGDHVGELCYMAYERNEQRCEGCGVAQVFKDGETHIVERSAPTDKGTVYVEITASPLRDSKGEIIAGIEVVHNITERRKAEEALRASEEMHRLIFQRSPVGIFHYDTRLIITDCNDRFIEILGSTREKLLHLDMKTLRDKRVLPSISVAIKGIEGGYEGGYRATTSGKEIWISMRTAPLLGRDNMVDGGIGIVEDITYRKLAEQAIEQQKQFTENLIQNSAIATFVIDTHHKVLIWNKACEELTGVPAPVMIGTTDQWKPFYSRQRAVMADIILDGNAEQMSSLYDRSSKSVLMPQGMHAEGWYLNLNGKDRYIVFDAAPIFDNAGNILASIETVQDFTERKKLEDQIHLAKQDWEDTFNTITDMVTVHDKDYNIIRANKAAEKILSLPFLEANKAKCFEHYHGTECPPAGCPSCQCLVTGKPSTFELYEPHLKMFIEIKAIPRFDAHNQLVGLIHVVRDISERKRSEEALKESEIKFRNLVEQSLVGIYIIQDSKFKYVNPRLAEIFGYASEELVDIKGPSDLTHPDDRPIVRANILKRQNGEAKSLHYAFRGLTKADSIIHAEVHGSSTLYDGKPAIIGSLVDITERVVAQDELLRRTEEAVLLRQAGKQLEEINRSKNEFLANMSHELRTPLNAIIGLSQVLLERTFGPLNDKQTEYLEGVRQSGNHLLSLINEILDLSKIEAGKEQFEPAVFSMHGTLQNAFMLVKEKAMKHGIELSQEIGPEVGLFYADEQRIKQILFNLLSNAVKFTQTGGSVGLKASQDQRGLMITVWDTGVGIPDDKRHLIFQPFQQLDSSLSRKHEGTGLGLVLSKRFVEMHGGAITFESREGGGTSFTVALPVQDHKQTGTQTHRHLSLEGPQRTGGLSAGKRIMIVEDDHLNMMLVADYLKGKAFEVVEAATGELALEEASRQRPDVVLLDIQMPGIDGFEVIRSLRENVALKEIPVIAMTALAMKGDEERCMQAGFDDYISKPVNLNEMLSKIDRCLGRGDTKE